MQRMMMTLLLAFAVGIVLGKLLESFCFLALLVFSSLPVMCLTMVLGGVGLGHILGGMLF